MVPEVEDRSKPDKSAAIQFKYGRIEAILRHRGITSQCLRAAVDYQPPHPTHLSVGHETYLPIHLTLLQRQLKALMTSTTRMTDLEREGNRPVTVSCDILCRDDFHQASSIAHVTRRRHSHVPSGRTRGFQSHTTHAYGREGVQDRHFYLLVARGKQKRCADTSLVENERIE
ncbi:hypothetical protein EVAR_36173_1 [Eumeta japonica]|uniref:Uncharacterized protein n=1 Tax=Eumeta variegata TaxID=151549 RepID=A0A4C1VSV8_EUMVA|nr:hypothetical protein EVAR_36173_1 [Eumeta japonica]